MIFISKNSNEKKIIKKKINNVVTFHSKLMMVKEKLKQLFLLQQNLWMSIQLNLKSQKK